MTQPRWDYLLLDAHLATLDGERGYGLIERGAIAWREGRIAFVGPQAELPDSADRCAAIVESVGGALITPGLIDCHTHLVFAGDRADEFEARLGGASYADIARAGGGIMSTVRHTRAADEDALVQAARPRAAQLMADGVTTIEIKSGYGLERDAETRQLRAARTLARELGFTVRSTFLGAHTLPPDYPGGRVAYVAAVRDWMAYLHAQGLIDAVDAYCEEIAFQPNEVRAIFAQAKRLGLRVKLHADQLSNTHGAALAAEFGALSADHLEYTDAAGVAALAHAGCVAVMLPGSFYALRETQLPPIAALRDAGVPLAVASDLNPGTSPVLSLRMAMNMACTLFRMTPEETLRGATVHAARALGLADIKGRLRVGMDADLAVWDAQHPAALSYWIGGTLAQSVFCAGEPR
jgi:imidazolonepropionase